MDAVTCFCNLCLESVGHAIEIASADSPLGRARAALGREAFVDTACRAMRVHVKRVLTEDPEARQDELRVSGDLALRAMTTDVVASIIRDIIRTANVVESATV